MQTNDEIQIVMLSPDEWIQYKDLRLRALKEEPHAYASTYDDNARNTDVFWRERLIDAGKGIDWLVFAKKNNMLVGMMGAFKKRSDPIDVVNIIAVYVVKEERGKGISKLLMKGLLDQIRRNKEITLVKLSVNKNQIPAVRLYEGFGFKIVGHINAKLGDGNYYDELLMEKEITN